MNKIGFLFFILAAVALSCKTQTDETQDSENNPTAEDAVEQSENQALYNEVMKVHDDVMPKMNDIYRKKEQLKNQIANTPNMPAEQKQAIELRIQKLDSAGEGMMQWMRKFNPLPDSLGEERAREYLENEMENVKKVRENILQALQEAEGSN